MLMRQPHDGPEPPAHQPGSKLDTSHAIATAYRGYEFRSRLEAKWACFFDLCGWQWSYEPLDLPGWIPDFVLGERRTLVEIKPFFDWTQYKAEAIPKVLAAGWTEPVILLGADPTWAQQQGRSYDGPSIGWVLEFFQGQNGLDWTVADLHFGFTEGNDKLGLCPMNGGWTNYIWSAAHIEDHPNKWSRVCLPAHDIEEELVARWAQASNVAKWIPIYPGKDAK